MVNILLCVIQQYTFLGFVNLAIYQGLSWAKLESLPIKNIETSHASFGESYLEEVSSLHLVINFNTGDNLDH